MLFFFGRGGGIFNQLCVTMHCFALSCRLYEDIGGLWLHEAVATLACSSTQAPPPPNAPTPPTNLSFSSCEEDGTASPFLFTVLSLKSWFFRSCTTVLDPKPASLLSWPIQWFQTSPSLARGEYVFGKFRDAWFERTRYNSWFEKNSGEGALNTSLREDLGERFASRSRSKETNHIKINK